MKIVPAILEKEFDNVIDLLKKYKSFTDEIQIDVCDGEFVDSLTWIPNHLEDIDGYNLKLEFDLMISNPISILDILLFYDISRVVIHARDMSDDEYRNVYATIKDKNSFVKVGLCLDGCAKEDVTRIKKLNEYCDYVQFMGIEKVGHQGQEFNENVLIAIKEIREYFIEIDEPKIVQVDGAMNEKTIKLCLDAGANSFVVGSAIKLNNDYKNNFTKLKNII